MRVQTRRADARRHLNRLNHLHHAETGDPEVLTRIAQYELGYRMQSSVPELMDTSKEPANRGLEIYGPDVHKPGSYAANCLLARRLAERGVRFIQLYHMGWDQHNNLPKGRSAASATTPISPRRR